MDKAGEGTAAKLSPVDWDKTLDNAFQAGPYSRITRIGDWQLITAMQVSLPDILKHALTRSGPLLILGDTVTAGKDGVERIDLTGFSGVFIIGRILVPHSDFFWQPPDPNAPWKFIIGLSPRHPEVPSTTLGEWAIQCMGRRVWLERPGRSVSLSGPRPGRINNMEIGGGGSFDFLSSWPLVLEGSKPFLSRIQLGALWLAAGGKAELASQLLECLQQILAIPRGEAGPPIPILAEDTFHDLRLQTATIRELLQPVRLERDYVPYLSPRVYQGVAREYGPALKAFADTFANFMNKNVDLEQRKQAARLILKEKGDAVSFQALVSQQLDKNLRDVKDNVTKARQSLQSQQNRVQQAESNFNSGLSNWEAEQKREAALAIVSGIFEFVGGIASIFAGNPGGAANAAKAAADVAKTTSKLAEIMQKLAKVAAVIAKVVKLCAALYEASMNIVNAQEFANRLSQMTVEFGSEDMKGAPSAGAYWDELWVNVETELALPIQKEIDGASDYLKELKILVIYGRALTTGQAALPPLMQEIARAKLLAEIAKRQSDAVDNEIDRLQAGQAAPAQAAATLWLRYRNVQRSMLVALQSYDAAHDYWALSNTPVERDLNRSIGDIAGDLLEIANIKDRQREALQKFSPPPQSFSRESYAAPQSAIDEFVRTGELVLRFTPGNSPLDGWGDVGRVRVNEICVWVDWIDGQRPSKGKVEFTVRTNGVYADQRVESGKVKSFCFLATPLNLTFRYDLNGYSDDNRYAAIRVPASVAEEFRTAYSEPTLFTEWGLSVPAGKAGDSAALDRAAIASAMSGITVEFSGTFIKDAPRLSVS